MTKRSQLDCYSMLIVGKYFLFSQDYFNVQQVNSKFKDLCSLYHYNPTSELKLFPKTQTQYLYSPLDPIIPNKYGYVVLYPIDYKKYLTMKNETFEFRKVMFDSHSKQYLITENRTAKIPEGVTRIDKNGFYLFSLPGNTTILEMPSTLKSIGKGAFHYCKFKIILNEGLRIIEDEVFENCNFQEIIIPSTVVKIGSFCFKNCRNLKKITILNSNIKFGSGCFQGCGKFICNIEIPKHAF